jgi:hypothetical protein
VLSSAGVHSSQERPMRGASVLEQLVVLALITIAFSMALPTMRRGVEHARLRGAAFYLSSRVAHLRMQAVHRGTNVALRFAAVDPYQYQAFMDGDGDGVRSADIADGRDPALGPIEAVQDDFRGVQFGFLPGCPLADGSTVPVGADPIRFGVPRLVVFSPAGTATSGTLYLRGRVDTAYAVVVLGATGRTRLLACTPAQGTWHVDVR